MSVLRLRSSFILLATVALALNSFADIKHKKAKAPVKQEQPAPAPAPAPVTPPPPPAELTLEQQPAVAPHVSYQNHQLTIVAENSTLGDILRAVRKETGAAVELPANANARIITHLGPGPSRDVIASMLNGTLFNYVLLGMANDPNAVGRIILTPKPTGAETQSAANVQPNGMMGQPSMNLPMNQDNLENDETEVEDAPPVPDQANEQQQPQQQVPPNAQQPGLRTPEQLLQELQRQQMLQQQMQQQQQQQQPQGNAPPAQDPNL